jgi:hypothetical protein
VAVLTSANDDGKLYRVGYVCSVSACPAAFGLQNQSVISGLLRSLARRRGPPLQAAVTSLADNGECHK